MHSKWPSPWQKFWFTIANWWLKRNGFLTGYDDGYWPWLRIREVKRAL